MIIKSLSKEKKIPILILTLAFFIAGMITTVANLADNYDSLTNQYAPVPVALSATNPVINGQCGTADGTTVASEPSGASLCSAGSATAVNYTGSGWTWSCNGTGGGTETASVSGTGVGAASPSTILTFIANPTTVVLGNNTNLSWTANGNISSCGVRDETNSIDFLGYNANDDFDTAPSPVGDVDYTLTCYSVDGNDTDTEVVTVLAASLPECSDGSDNDSDGLTDFPNDSGCTDANDDDETDTALPLPSLDVTNDNVVASGATANVTWDAENVSECDFTAGAGLTTGAGNPIAGSDSTSSLTEDEIFTILCTGPNGDISRTRTIGVLPGMGGFRVPDYVVSGGTLNFEWDPVLGTNVTCVGVSIAPASDGIAPDQWSLGNKNVAGGNQDVGPLSAGGTYQLSCSNVHGTPAPLSQVVTVLNPSVSLFALPAQVLVGRSAVLVWEAQGVESACRLSKIKEGEVDEIPIPDTNYTYTAGSSYNSTALSDNNSYTTLPVRTNTLFTATCDTASGFVSTSVTIKPFTPEFEER